MEGRYTKLMMQRLIHAWAAQRQVVFEFILKRDKLQKTDRCIHQTKADVSPAPNVVASLTQCNTPTSISKYVGHSGVSFKNFKIKTFSLKASFDYKP